MRLSSVNNFVLNQNTPLERKNQQSGFVQNNLNDSVSFNGKMPSGLTIIDKIKKIPTAIKKKFSEMSDVISKFFGEQYAIKIIDKKWVRNFSEKLSKIGGNMTEHMATVGSLITSGVYVTRTLTNKELDNSKKKTLAINQGLCFIVPTICAYTVNKALTNFNKSMEYDYGHIKDRAAALGKMTAKEAKDMRELTSKRLKGFKTLASLMTFTLIYRYATPVIITPAANWIGRKLEGRKQNKEKLALENNKQTEKVAA